MNQGGGRTGQRGPGRQVTIMSAVAGTLALVVILVAAVWAVDWWREDEPDVPQPGVSLSDVRDDPEQYLGERLSLSGEIETLISEQAFTFDEDNILVVFEDGADVDEAVQLEEGEGVMAEGIVHRPGADEIRDRVSGQVLDDFTGDVAFLASNVMAPAEEGLEPPRPEERGILVQTIVDDFDQYEGEQVTAVGSVTTPIDQRSALFGGLRLDEDSMLMVGDVPEGMFTLNARAVVTGTVRTFSIEEAESELGIDLDDGLVEEYEGEPAIYVDDFVLLPLPENIRQNPTAFFEEPVETVGTIDEVYEDEIFTLDGELLVFAPGIEDEPLPGADVRLDGTVAVVDTELTPEQIDMDVPQAILDEWQGFAFLYAEDVEIFR